MSAETTLSTFVASAGDNVVVQDWPVQDGIPLRGMVIVVHGLGEHTGRYDYLARHLNAWGFAVRGYDQYGHGESGGAYGSLPTDTRLLDDLADMVDCTRARMRKDMPLILLGHSLGGLVAARFVSLAIRPVDALVLSSPAFDPGLTAWQKFLLSFVPRLAPNFRVSNGLNPEYLSHDPAVVAAYRVDPLVHNRISARLANFVARTGPKVLAMAPHWKVPTLLMYAGGDRLLNPMGSRRFARAAPKTKVKAVRFDAMYHEIFNELDAAPVYATLQRWLDRVVA
jgi:alpha-beta hydrolase superfamily lysophospholipase